MIERQVIDGETVTVAYLKEGMEPGTPDDYDMVKIIYDDGRTVWARPEHPEQPAAVPDDAA